MLLVMFCTPLLAMAATPPAALDPERAFAVLAGTGALDADAIALHGWLTGVAGPADDAAALAGLQYTTIQDMTLVKAMSEGAMAIAYGDGADRAVASVLGRWAQQSDNLRCAARQIQPVAVADLAPDEVDMLFGATQVSNQHQAYRAVYQCAMPSLHRTQVVAGVMRALSTGDAVPDLPTLRSAITRAEQRDAQAPAYFQGEVLLGVRGDDQHWSHTPLTPASIAVDRMMGEVSDEQSDAQTQAAIIDAASRALAGLPGADRDRRGPATNTGSGAAQARLADDVAAALLLRFPQPLQAELTPHARDVAAALAKRAGEVRCSIDDGPVQQRVQASADVVMATVSMRCTLPLNAPPLPVMPDADADLQQITAHYAGLLDTAAKRLADATLGERTVQLEMIQSSLPEGNRWQPASAAMANLLLSAALPEQWMTQLQDMLLPMSWLPPELRYDALDPAALEQGRRARLQQGLQKLRERQEG